MLTSDLTGSGIGREVALTLASRGARALICAGINLKAAIETAEMNRSRNADHLPDEKVHALYVDVTDENSVQQMAIQTKLLFGRIDYFVNTAGVSSNPTDDHYTLQSNQLKFEMYSPFVALFCSKVGIAFS